MTLEEGAKAARTFIEAMKTQPLALALCLMNLGLLGFLYYVGISNSHERQRQTDLLYENRKYVTDALSSCIHVNDLDKILKRQP